MYCRVFNEMANMHFYNAYLVETKKKKNPLFDVVRTKAMVISIS